MLYSYPIRARSTPYTLAKKIHNLFKQISLKERKKYSFYRDKNEYFFLYSHFNHLIFPLILSRAGKLCPYHIKNLIIHK